MLSLSTTAPPYLLVSPNSLPKLSPHFLSSFMTNSRREEKEYRKKKLVFRFCCCEVVYFLCTWVVPLRFLMNFDLLIKGKKK
jgi:hypothetical protein